MFKVNNRNTRTSVSIFNLEQVNAGWESFSNLNAILKIFNVAKDNVAKLL